jgi:hypothetical protein
MRRRAQATSGSFRQNAALPWALESHPRCGDCFVALRAPRNDGVCVSMTTLPRHCERSEAISPHLLSPMFGSAISTSSFLRPFIEPCGSVAARRIPADCRAKLSVSNPSPLQVRVAERRNSRARNAAPVGLPCGMASPVSGRDCRPITRAGAPFGAPLRHFP